MREVFSCTNPALTGFCQSILERAGIACSLADSEKVSRSSGLHFTAVCVVQDSDYDEANRILESNAEEIQMFRPDWTCPSCSEINSGKIEVCRTCKAMRPGILDKSIYDVLARIRSKPAMYIGEKSIVRLDAFLQGISTGLAMANLALRDVHDFRRFYDWVARRLGFYESTSGWCNMILSKSSNDEEALKQFFVLLDEFRKDSAERTAHGGSR